MGFQRGGCGGEAMAQDDRFRVQGGANLRGEVHITGAKNSVLKLMAAALLAPGTSTITNVPDIADVDIMADLLTRLGCSVNHNGSELKINVPETPGPRRLRLGSKDARIN